MLNKTSFFKNIIGFFLVFSACQAGEEPHRPTNRRTTLLQSAATSHALRAKIESASNQGQKQHYSRDSSDRSELPSKVDNTGNRVVPDERSVSVIQRSSQRIARVDQYEDSEHYQNQGLERACDSSEESATFAESLVIHLFCTSARSVGFSVEIGRAHV